MNILSALVMLAALAALPTHTATPTENPSCVRYFHSACSEALGAWLPTNSLPFSSDEWNDGKSTQIHRRDGFIVGKRPPQPYLGFEGPDGGTFFVYGDAGPPRGHVVYDYTHGIVFYEQGCCSGEDVVEAENISPPPKRVANQDLRGLRTYRGIRLGQTPSDVMRIYGDSKLRRVLKHPHLRTLAYTTWPPRKDVTYVHAPCGQMENFYFRANHLVLIQFGNGC